MIDTIFIDEGNLTGEMTKDGKIKTVHSSFVTLSSMVPGHVRLSACPLTNL